MNKAIILTFLILLSTIPIICVNHLDLMFEMDGVNPYGDYGAGLAALDFNGDGYDDLAVLQQRWVPDSLSSQSPYVQFGRILIYYGGPGLDSTPDFIVEGTYNYEFSYGDGDFVDLGDVNGDGFDDLGVRGNTDFGSGTVDDQRSYIAVYFGGLQPSLQPGYYQAFLSDRSWDYVEIDPLGDINNDGFDDFSYTLLVDNYYPDLSRTAFILGGSMTEVTWRQFDSSNFESMSPVGDVNHDGFDDYICTFATGNPFSVSNTVYYSSASATPSDSLLLYTGQNSASFIFRAKYLGDVNGDGVDDFAGLILHPNISLWFGNENLTNQFNLNLTPQWSGNSNDDRGLVHGDLNGDGFDDVIGSEPMSFGENGGFRIWMGGANMNGTSDLTKEGTFTGMLLGTAMAAGDFNGDGLSDIAASAPHSSTFDATAGRVYIFSGNTQLADTTVSSEDNVIVPVPDNWDFRVIPNPVNNKQNWKLRFTGKGYDKYNPVAVKIFNLKGQLLKTLNISSGQMKAGEVNLEALNLPYGVYELSLFQKGSLLKTKKVTLR